MGDERQRLLEIIKRDAVTRGDFILSSGRRASFYIDLRLVTLAAEGSYLVGKTLLALLGAEPADAVAGMTVAADPVVTAMALVSHVEALSADDAKIEASSADDAKPEGRPLAGLIVRKEAKQHGLGRRVEGPLRPGMRVVVVDDTFTTGGSALQAAEAVTAAGGEVARILGIVDRGEGARAAIEARGYRFDCLFTLADLGLEHEA